MTRRTFLLLPLLSLLPPKDFFSVDETIEQQRAYNATAAKWNENAAPAWTSLSDSLFTEVVPAEESQKRFRKAWEISLDVVKRARRLGKTLEVAQG